MRQERPANESIYLIVVADYDIMMKHDFDNRVNFPVVLLFKVVLKSAFKVNNGNNKTVSVYLQID